MMKKTINFLRIGIVGAGFSGTSLAAVLHQLTDIPVEIILFEKTGFFGTGKAYSTPYPFHLLNVRARDMSAFEDQPEHFVDWLRANNHVDGDLDNSMPIEDQFVSRYLYGNYLKDLLKNLSVSEKIKITLIPVEVIDIALKEKQAILMLGDGKEITVDKVVLALGNNMPAEFSFPVSSREFCVTDPWDYTALKKISKNDPVLILGTGLSMIDAVLTLHHQSHQGKIYAVSRHGLLPLPHSDNHITYEIEKDQLPDRLRELTKFLLSISKSHIKEGGDWRSIINAVRTHVPALWERASVVDKKRFLRHILSYWNIHRHRVHKRIADLLEKLSVSQQFEILSGRILSVEEGIAKIQMRHKKKISQIQIRWLINSMGPSIKMTASEQPLIQSLLRQGLASFDPLELGFAISQSGALKDLFGNVSALIYTIGPPGKGTVWECSAVPEIRKQSFELAKCLLGN